MAGKLQDGVAIAKIKETINLFCEYSFGDLVNNRREIVGRVHDARKNAALAWPDLIMNCFLHSASHYGVVKFLLDIALSTRFGDFTLLGVSSQNYPFYDLHVVMTKAFCNLDFAKDEYLMINDSFSSMMSAFLDEEGVHSAMSMELGIHDIEDRFVLRTKRLFYIIHEYHMSLDEIEPWLEKLPDASGGTLLNQKSKEQMRVIFSNAKVRIANSINLYVTNNTNSYNEYVREVAEYVADLWNIQATTNTQGHENELAAEDFGVLASSSQMNGTKSELGDSVIKSDGNEVKLEPAMFTRNDDEEELAGSEFTSLLSDDGRMG
uniref:Minor outer capsid protein P9 n=1 Tax=Rice gall dwarf virus TaxID=10986 RepID=Q2I126_RGDV|nr:nonstructural protein Pns10 [Rice gall dwarf virus]ABD16176.1 36K protein [Rice gall dwarf virus]